MRLGAGRGVLSAGRHCAQHPGVALGGKMTAQALRPLKVNPVRPLGVARSDHPERRRAGPGLLDHGNSRRPRRALGICFPQSRLMCGNRPVKEAAVPVGISAVCAFSLGGRSWVGRSKLDTKKANLRYSSLLESGALTGHPSL